MSLSRRGFLASGAAGLAFSGLAQAVRAQAPESYRNEVTAYGPLRRDPLGVFDLPEGFEYRIVSQAGETMADGLLVPAKFDGMGCFSAPGRFGFGGGSRVALVRNHELDKDDVNEGACGIAHHLLDRLDMSRAYGRDAAGMPLSGGTTTLIYDLEERRTIRQHLSLAGTSTNCAGGVTPWGSWLTCEETSIQAGEEVQQDHGWVFEVPANARGLVEPRPLRAMGRFDHEAACVDPSTGVVYMTEDEDDSLFYRFIPDAPGRLHEGGRLQALAVRGAPGADLRNWEGRTAWRQGGWLDVDWIDLDDVESPNGDLRQRGHAAGAALFARGEGLHWGDGEMFFTATSGGSRQFGQIVRHVPDANGGRIQLFIESSDDQVYDYGDNLTVAPWGHLLVCEDRYSTETNHLRGVTPEGRIYTLARNVYEGNSELAGVCFSPDGSTLFVNIQSPGITLAITGPWSQFQNS